MTTIEWVQNPDGTKGETWNPIVGCTKVSPGCTHCYAETMAKRLKAMGQQRYQTVVDDRGWTGQIELVEYALQKPIDKKRPTTYFVNSMSDLFHEGVSTDYISRVFEVMAACPRHTFQVLTKRPERMLELAEYLPWASNIWTGVSVEQQRYADRIDLLRQVPASVRFLSCEPLLGALDLNLDDIHWVIVGGESGVGHRPIDPDWVRSIRDRCLETGTPFFFKQWGGRTPKAGGRSLDGVEWNQMPARMEVAA